MEGDPRIDKLMLPVLATIDRHVKDSDAKTEIYNRAYEALLESMDALDTSAKVTAKQIAENAKNLQRAEAAEAKVAELEAATRWIPVTEKLPEWGVLVLVAQRDKHGSTMGQLWHDDVWLVYDKIFTDQKYWVYPETYHSVTHWMPLPKPPKEELK